MAALSQPLFGVIADRFGTRLTGAALAWTALTFAGVGLNTDFRELGRSGWRPLGT